MLLIYLISIANILWVSKKELTNEIKYLPKQQQIAQSEFTQTIGMT